MCGTVLEKECQESIRYIEVTPPNKGTCIRRGILESIGCIIFVCDADLPVKIENLVLMKRCLEYADIAIGDRYIAGSEFAIIPIWYRRLISKVFRLLLRILFNLGSLDTQCGVKAFNRLAALRIYEHEVVRSLVYEVQILLRAYQDGLKIIQVPVSWRSSRDSTIKSSRVMIPALIDLLRLRSRLTLNISPL